MKYMVSGVGGIGGYLAALLLKQFPQDVTLVVRGQRKAALERQGLVMHSVRMGDVIFPDLNLTDEPASAGVQDMIFVATKNYSLVDALEALRPCVGDKTIIVPVLNGIDHGQVTQETLQRGYVVDSLIYLGAHYNDDYTYSQDTAYGKLVIGSPWAEQNEIVRRTLDGPNLECVISADLKSELWHKYIVNCAYNTITAYYKCATRGLLKPPSCLDELNGLLQEAVAVGKADGARLPDNLIETINNQFLHERNLDTTSSMATDVMNGRRTEIETFGGHLTRLAKRLGVPVPLSDRFYAEMKKQGL